MSSIIGLLKSIHHFIRSIPSFFMCWWWRIKGCKIGKDVVIQKKVTMTNPRFVSIGNGSLIRHHTSFTVNPIQETAELIIGKGVRLGKYCDFGCSNKIVIEDYVIIAPFVHITDRDHSYCDVSLPIKNQPSCTKGPVVIKSGCWIGYGAQVMSGLTIGEHSVIAAGSIVTNDIPEYCMAGGNPARVLKKFNNSTGKWERV